MHLSLSVRIAEHFHTKEVPQMPLTPLAELARASGYAALCMRASQVGVHSPREQWLEAARLLKEYALAVSMVTGDFAMVYNNDRGPDCLRNITPYLDLADQFGSRLIRVAVKSADDIPWAQRAADEAAERAIRLVHQCHTLSLFETVEEIERTLLAIGRDNFGLVYEPANLELCGQDYTEETLQRLAPWIFNVYLQNQVLSPTGSVTLTTWCRGPVSFDLLPIHKAGGVDFAAVFAGLKKIGYAGWVTVHQAAVDGETVSESASRTAEYLRKYL